MSGYFENRRPEKRKLVSEINVTPLVDVMLVLLVIFMVTSPMLMASIKVDLPETSSTASSEQVEPLTVSVDEKGNIYLQEERISKEKLVSKLIAITAEKFDTRIFVRGDKKLTYGYLVELISDISEAGFTKVALVTNVKQTKKAESKS